jgi:hypothetical protein
VIARTTAVVAANRQKPWTGLRKSRAAQVAGIAATLKTARNRMESPNASIPE